MVEVELRWVHAKRNRHGKWRYYYRRQGYPRIRLPGEPGSPQFLEAYNAAGKVEKPVAAPVAGRETPGSVAALVREYQGSSDHNGLAETTRREMGYVLKDFVKGFGSISVKTIERQHVARWRDAMQGKPGAANKMLRYLSVLFSFAVERGYRPDHPIRRMKKLAVGKFRPWSLEERIAFESRWQHGSLARLGYALALYTGQRRADLASLTFASISTGSLRLTQGKTGKTLSIPIHPELKKALPAIYPRDETPILSMPRRRKKNTTDGVSSKTRPLSPVYFGHFMGDSIEKAGLPVDCVLHGLRKCAAVALIEAGCTPHQAAAITGQTLKMLEEYAKDHDQAKLAREAMDKWAKK